MHSLSGLRTGRGDQLARRYLPVIDPRFVKLVSVGDQVTQGQVLAVLEAMKMEIRLQAPSGTAQCWR